MPRKLTKYDFVEKARKIHGNKYDYSKVEYKDSHTKVCIICPIHGEFWITPTNHLYGKGCSKCSNKYKYTTEEFIKKAREIHGNKYDYSKVIYKNNKTKVCIICPIHGEFWQRPSSHLSGLGCEKCGYEEVSSQNRYTTEEFIKKAIEMHGDKYNYSKVEYKDSHTKVCIICPKHGEFWQTPNSHLNGNGCPICKSSKLEEEMRKLLNKKDIVFEEQKKFSWLGKQSLDFYLSQYKVAIECQGKQHFGLGGWSSDKNEVNEDFIKTKQRDKRKFDLCKQNNIKILYYSNLGIDYPYEVFEDKEKLLKEIIK